MSKQLKFSFDLPKGRIADYYLQSELSAPGLVGADMVVLYEIYNTINGKSYIGQTTNPTQRWRQHRHMVKSSTLPLYRAISKYGVDNFTFTPFMPCSTQAIADFWERMLIEKYKTAQIDFGYNIALGGNGVGKHSEDTKRKIGEANKGRVGKPHSSEWRKKMSAIMSGRKVTWGDKISAALTGMKRSEESKGRMRGRVMSEAQREANRKRSLGRKHSPETRAKMSATRKGRVGNKPSEATKKKLSDMNRGKKLSADTVAKMSKRYLVVDPSGFEIIVVGMKAFCRANRLDSKAMFEVAAGKRENHKGYRARHYEK